MPCTDVGALLQIEDLRAQVTALAADGVVFLAASPGDARAARASLGDLVEVEVLASLGGDAELSSLASGVMAVGGRCVVLVRDTADGWLVQTTPGRSPDGLPLPAPPPAPPRDPLRPFSWGGGSSVAVSALVGSLTTGAAFAATGLAIDRHRCRTGAAGLHCLPALTAAGLVVGVMVGAPLGCVVGAVIDRHTAGVTIGGTF